MNPLRDDIWLATSGRAVPPLVHGRVWADGRDTWADLPLYTDKPRDRITLAHRLASSFREEAKRRRPR